MSQEWLNGLAHLLIDNDILYDIDFKKIIKDFASKKARKVNFI